MVKKKQSKKTVEQEAVLPETSVEDAPVSADWVSEILPDEDIARESLRPLMLRRRVRYNLFRLQNEEEKGVPADTTPDGFKEFFEAQEWFDGWGNFGKTWDVGDPMEPKPRGSDNPLEVVPRYLSIHEEWDEVIGDHVKSDTLTTRKRARAQQMEEANGSEDNVRRDES
jgi:hypothetical protein